MLRALTLSSVLLAFACSPTSPTDPIRILSPPIAVIAPSDLSAPTGEAIAFDGSGSYDPEGQALKFAWAVRAAPAGSTASLAGASSATVSFTPDLVGTYVIELKVSTDDRTSGEAIAVLTAVPPPSSGI